MSVEYYRAYVKLLPRFPFLFNSLILRTGKSMSLERSTTNSSQDLTTLSRHSHVWYLDMSLRTALALVWRPPRCRWVRCLPQNPLRPLLLRHITRMELHLYQATVECRPLLRLLGEASRQFHHHLNRHRQFRLAGAH